MLSRRRALSTLGGLAFAACTGEEPTTRPRGPIRIVFKHGPLGGDPRPFEGLLRAFERTNPDVEVSAELLPNAAGAAHQYFVTALEGAARNFDVFILDVIWVAEFARAGWLANLADMFPPERVRRDFLPGPAEAVLVEGGTYAVPWYADVGVLFRRTDLVPRAPRTYADLTERAARAIATKASSIHGYLWQGLQSEGLVCVTYEAIWGHGGSTMSGARVVIGTREARAALDYLRGLLTSGITPGSVTSMGEEETRRVFQSGGAAFMRNWPYAWAEAQSPGSPVRGKVGLSALPSETGAPGAGALGGFHLALNAHTSPWKQDAGRRLIRHLASPEAALVLALSYGRNPARRAVYDDPRLVAGAPAVVALLPMLERARPRPVTPYYPMIADTLAAEFSAAITGIRSAAEAVDRAQTLVDHVILEVE